MAAGRRVGPNVLRNRKSSFLEALWFIPNVITNLGFDIVGRVANPPVQQACRLSEATYRKIRVMMMLGITDNRYPQYVPKQPRTAYLNSTIRWDYETYHPTTLVTGIPSLLRSGPQCFARQISVRRFDNRRSRRNNIPATLTFVSYKRGI